MANEVYKNDANLRGLWLLEETSGVRYDYTANDNDLTDNNTVGYSADSQEGDYSADFENSNDEYLSITDGDQTGLDVTGDFTICCWIKPESLTDATGHNLVAKYDTASNQRSYNFWLLKATGGYYPRLNVSSDGSGYAAADADTPVTAGSWVHLAAVYNGTDLRIYRNGSLDITPVSYSSGIHNGTAEFRLGRHSSSAYPYDGLLDEVAIFDRALSADEIISIYNYGVQDPPSGIEIFRRRREMVEAF